MSLENIQEPAPQGLLGVINKLMLVIAVLVIGLIAIPFVIYYQSQPADPDVQTTVSPVVGESKTAAKKADPTVYWAAPDINQVTDAPQKELVGYGKELIVHTSKYLGPKGTVQTISNGMNCQNCHLQAGTAVFGNNYGSVASQFPKFRARSGTTEDVYKRVNDCFERSLNGKALNKGSKEMKAIAAYINFLGTNVEKGQKAAGAGLKELAYLDRAADPAKGKAIYTNKCQSCHQANGEGLLLADQSEYAFPPLWGDKSYNDGAGLYRISNFARYVKYNMPQGVTHLNPQLSDEEAWDVAAFVNDQPRPHINAPKDWPDKSKKPVDHPFGPYADSFSETQHKFGPFAPIEAAQQKSGEPAKAVDKKETTK